MSRSSRPTCSVLAGTVVVSALALLFVVYRALTGAGPLFDFGDGDTSGGGGATSTAWFDVWFADPSGPASNTLRGGPDAHLAESIEGARLTVDVAIYDLDLWSIRDALLDAHRRGVAVRVVTESDNLDEPEVQDLIDAGIPLLADRREGLMHNKFVIVDRLDVWTGSMNFTVNGAYRNDNNLVRMRSSRLARNYLVEFEEMFVSDRFGPGSPANTPQTVMEIDGTQLELYFSPDDGTAERLIELVRQADESVVFMAFSFTSDDLAAALIDQARAGVAVRGVMEESQVNSNIGTEYGRLRSAGLEVHLDGNPRNMHHKVIVIDDAIVITGSYNFSASAEERNDENTVIIHSPAIAALYMAEFERVFGMAQP